MNNGLVYQKMGNMCSTLYFFGYIHRRLRGGKRVGWNRRIFRVEIIDKFCRVEIRKRHFSILYLFQFKSLHLCALIMQINIKYSET